MSRGPDKRIAAALGIFIQPLALVYVARPYWALLYLIAILSVATAKIAFPSGDGAAIWADACIVSIALIAAIHAWRVAARFRDGDARPAYTRWYALTGIVAAFLATGILFRGFVLEPFRAPSSSMAPTLPKGSYLLVSKWGYGHYVSYGVSLYRAKSSPLARGDLVVFDFPPDPQKVFFKRVIGLPGDKVSYREKRLSINGVAVSTREIPQDSEVRIGTQTLRKLAETLDGRTYFVAVDDARAPLHEGAVRDFPGREHCTYDARGFECLVPPDHYFFMGDNRDNSDDSRYWGFVPDTAIVGKVWHIFPAE